MNDDPTPAPVRPIVSLAIDPTAMLDRTATASALPRSPAP